MECVGVLLKEEWEYNSLTKMFSGGDDEADCSMLHFLQNFGSPSEFVATGEADALFYSSENFYVSSELTDSSTSASNYITGNCFPNHLTPLTMNEMIPREFVTHEEEDYYGLGNWLKEEIAVGNADARSSDLVVVVKRKFDEPQQSEAVKVDQKFDEPQQSEAVKKKSRVPRDTMKSKKNQLVQNDEETPSCISEDASNASQHSSALNSTGKPRAGRGAATDPQSLYARKRRERINERLRTLQHLVPNGTKLDITTMLEEAVQYVKFLQLQIKLLSCDDTWMYAPIAYNGMDMGLYHNISP